MAVAKYNRSQAEPILNSPKANITFGTAENITLRSNISHNEVVYHLIYDGGCHASPGSPWAFLPPADGNRLVFFGKTVPIIILCRRRKSGIEINFKKVFTNRFCCDIIPFANARYSGCGVNLFEVITCRILGAEANILMR